MEQRSFGRGQVEWALWRAVHGVNWRNQPVPKAFLTRIKRLLEIDRDPALIDDVEVPPTAEYAFAPPPDESAESSYTLADAVCLAVALDLLDAGFKQREIVVRMRYLRPDLEKRLRKLISLPPPLTLKRLKDDHRSFIVLGQVEMTEMYPVATSRRIKGPILLEPVFCDGLSGLTQHLEKLMPMQRRVAVIVEIAGLAHAVSGALERAPVIRRGRPKN
ncbi:hypothetical protein [Terricaulis silvestris]|uniref:Uncharacterized protein n=1 Tax=Terricaulis silvestris TaxID=2686094 RepID=A0A6I6MZF9_9CAUL|nr:hypothetical protein [Terricaulis silvestris]QGZ96513.1 hypothetical protein DSM104635_03373 [Terricaulis silvestris]